jgi:D-glycero-D-manno-heptose 1,7-bisphosphate phosphatase
MKDHANIELADISHVFLDRDGVLNRNPPHGQFVTCCEEFELLPGVEDAVAELNQSGRKVIVVTNQRAIALGLYSQQDLERIHALLKERLAMRRAWLDAIYVCPHDDGQCNCRKPLTGLFEQAFQDFPAARPENSVMVGDSVRDVEAGNRMGMRTVFIIGDRKTASAEAERAHSLATLLVASLPDFVRRLLAS